MRSRPPACGRPASAAAPPPTSAPAGSAGAQSGATRRIDRRAAAERRRRDRASAIAAAVGRATAQPDSRPAAPGGAELVGRHRDGGEWATASAPTAVAAAVAPAGAGCSRAAPGAPHRALRPAAGARSPLTTATAVAVPRRIGRAVDGVVRAGRAPQPVAAVRRAPNRSPVTAAEHASAVGVVAACGLGPERARGNGARQRDGSKSKAWRALPWFSACDSSSSCGARKFQSSRTCCRRLAMPVA